MNFAIVEFIADESVDVIPLNWLINDNICSWPPYRGSRFTSAVTKCEDPLDSWSQFPLRVMGYYGLWSIF